MKEQQKQKVSQISINNVHRTAISLAALRFKLGQFDAALTSTLEAIRIAQNKNDYSTILDCTIWFHQISGAMGNREMEKQLIEHTVY